MAPDQTAEDHNGRFTDVTLQHLQVGIIDLPYKTPSWPSPLMLEAGLSSLLFYVETTTGCFAHTHCYISCKEEDSNINTKLP